jgi:hypothetical protein
MRGMDHNAKQSESASPFSRFKELVRQLISVPKKEIERRESAYQRRKAEHKRNA